MKGIILAGGNGTRLYPLTISCSKQLLPIYDKPLIYYPLTTLMDLNIKDILIICKKIDINGFYNLLGDGSDLGINIKYEVQNEPRGIAEAIIIGSSFIGNDNIALILGDNIFHGLNFNKIKIYKKCFGSMIFLYSVPDAEKYGVATIKNKKIIEIIEKPKKPKSNLIVTGLYFYDNQAIEIAKSIKPSKRNELEITDVNNYYIINKKLNYTELEEGVLWLDAGNPESLFRASEYVKIIQERRQVLIGSPHLSSFNKKWISLSSLKKTISKFSNTDYQEKIRKICNF